MNINIEMKKRGKKERQWSRNRKEDNFECKK
jgi:hypothetical protein